MNCSSSTIDDILSTFNDCIVSYERVIVLQKLQPSFLRQFYTEHPDINHVKALVWSYVYWHHMDQQLEQLVCSGTKYAFASKALTMTTLKA
ncbi:unnamed protein product [Schistocephalus solidus]|uniref:DDE-1 domain-containing protein n=1 Tax=Schistocephalus solidus TaxID=70667 RepID=A0A183SP32_SCHSO|nr:unnamed protein product [Schistocephalus solidus]